MNLADIDVLLAEWERIVIAERVQPAHCILGTRTLFDVMRVLDIPAQVVPVEALIWNMAAAPLIAAEIPFQQWPPNAWSVGAVTSAPGEGYPGHLILVADTDDGRVLIDSSTGQFVRTRHGITPPPTLAARVSDTWPSDPTISVKYTGPGWEMSWKWAPELGNLHRSAPDWRRSRGVFLTRLLDSLNRKDT